MLRLGTGEVSLPRADQAEPLRGRHFHIATTKGCPWIRPAPAEHERAAEDEAGTYEHGFNVVASPPPGADGDPLVDALTLVLTSTDAVARRSDDLEVTRQTLYSALSGTA